MPNFKGAADDGHNYSKNELAKILIIWRCSKL